MKKTFSLMALLLAFATFSSAQVNPNAIGLRLGGGNVNGAEISYQGGISSNNRLEVDLGISSNKNYSSIGVAAIYQWVWNIVEDLNWYVGPGAAAGLGGSSDNLNLGVSLGGQIGLEYDFNNLGAPLLLSLDFRPMWDFLGDNSGLGWGTALGIRYTW